MKYVLAIVAFVLIFSCKETKKEFNKNPKIIHQLNEALLEAVVNDGFPPPVASRVYAYPNIAAYEAMAMFNSNHYTSLSGQLKAFNHNLTAQGTTLSSDIVLIKAFCETGKFLVYRGFIIEETENQLLAPLKEQVSSEDYDKSVALGKQLADAIIEWANTDGYIETRNMPKFTIIDTPGAWKPTAPKYGEAIEPHWFRLRPFVIDSNSAYRVMMPLKFSTDKNSDFYKAAAEVYDIVNKITEEEIIITKYWDDNPSPSVVDGHVMTTNRQNSPPGHWLGIARTAMRKEKTELNEACEIYARTAIAMADGFKSCWDTKYANNTIRPETYIKEYIDADWKPKLETPLFPEFTSAHSLISVAAATTLASYFGKDYAFSDSSNVPYGHAVRNFKSFMDAADEAAYSRILGGIHYQVSCDMGKDQGIKVGETILSKITTKKKH